MEEKKFDPYQFIGFVLIAVILTWMLYRNGPDEEATPVQVTTEQGTTAASTPEVVQVSDSILQQQKVEAFGDLGTLFVPKAIENVKIQTDNFSVEVQSKGGQIALFQLDEFENFEDAPSRLIDQSNADFNIMMTTLDGRIMNTREMYF
jgi:YidC/Oxa1 family membrane protein insertase